MIFFFIQWTLNTSIKLSNIQCHAPDPIKNQCKMIKNNVIYASHMIQDSPNAIFQYQIAGYNQIIKVESRITENSSKQ